MKQWCNVIHQSMTWELVIDLDEFYSFILLGQIFHSFIHLLTWLRPRGPEMNNNQSHEWPQCLELFSCLQLLHCRHDDTCTSEGMWRSLPVQRTLTQCACADFGFVVYAYPVHTAPSRLSSSVVWRGKMSKTILVIGASGTVGQGLAKVILERGKIDTPSPSPVPWKYYNYYALFFTFEATELLACSDLKSQQRRPEQDLAIHRRTSS